MSETLHALQTPSRRRDRWRVLPRRPGLRISFCLAIPPPLAKFSLDLRDLEAATVLEALGAVPETQWPGTEASTLEMSTDSEVTFRKVLGSAEVLPTRPGVDPLEVTRPLADVSWTSQSPQATSPFCYRLPADIYFAWAVAASGFPRVWTFDHSGRPGFTG